MQPGAVTLAVGGGHACAVMVGGGVKCWGQQYALDSVANRDLIFGVGDGTSETRLTAVNVSGLSSGVTELAAGGAHTCALQAGGVKCWGTNLHGQLGDETTSGRLTPVSVVGLGSGVAKLAGGGNNTCAVTSGGAVLCWGFNSMGQVGDGTETNRVRPVAVAGLSSGVAAVAVGSAHSCALTSGGEVLCWGMNLYGQVGDGTKDTNQLTPVDVVGFSRTNVTPTVTPTVQPTATPAPAGFNDRAQAVGAGAVHSSMRNCGRSHSLPPPLRCSAPLHSPASAGCSIPSTSPRPQPSPHMCGCRPLPPPAPGH